MKPSNQKLALVHRLAVFLVERRRRKELLFESESGQIVSDLRPRLAVDWKEIRELVPGAENPTSIPEMEKLLLKVL